MSSNLIARSNFSNNSGVYRPGRQPGHGRLSLAPYICGMLSRRRDLSALALSILACFAVSALGGAVTREPVQGWYRTLQKPAGLTPPDIAFPIVWTILFALMALAAWRVWRAAYTGPGGWRAARPALLLFGLQLALNLLWSVLFFGLQRPAWALVEIAALWLAIATCLRAFWPLDRPAAWMLAPYLAWVSYAALLNGLIVGLNRG